MQELTSQFREYLDRTVLLNPWIPHTPTPKQALYLCLPHKEAFYGGAAGGGKSDALLMGGLQYADVPGYSALLIRKTFADLALPGALMDRSKAWLMPTRARWYERDKVWAFPSGATLTFGYLDSKDAHFRYQGAEFQFIGVDEATQIPENQYRYLFSRLRKLKGAVVPLRMRAASNPGGLGHEWVKRRFVTEASGKRPFIPAHLEDNPYLDIEEYEESLAELDPITRHQLRHGDWDVSHDNGIFKREWFTEILDQRPAGPEWRWVRYWDLAATEPTPGKDPDWTVGSLVGRHMFEGWYCIADVKRIRTTPLGVETLVRQTAIEDGPEVAIRMEQEAGASGPTVIDHFARKVLVGYNFKGMKPGTNKMLRALPVSSAAEAGNIKLVKGRWIGPLLDEMVSFPTGHDDQVDTISGSFEELKGVANIRRI